MWVPVDIVEGKIELEIHHFTDTTVMIISSNILICFSSVKSVISILTWIELNMQTVLGIIVILAINSSNPWTWSIFPLQNFSCVSCSFLGIVLYLLN